MLALVEHARSTAYHAAWALDDTSDDPDLAVANTSRRPCSTPRCPTAGSWRPRADILRHQI
jgi:hypothetical protein